MLAKCKQTLKLGKHLPHYEWKAFQLQTATAWGDCTWVEGSVIRIARNKSGAIKMWPKIKVNAGQQLQQHYHSNVHIIYTSWRYRPQLWTVSLWLQPPTICHKFPLPYPHFFICQSWAFLLWFGLKAGKVKRTSKGN